MKIGIIGYGTVGRAIAQGLTKKKHFVLVNDKKFSTTLERGGGFTNEGLEIVDKKTLAKECEIIFICVDTPTGEFGCDLRAVYDSYNELHMAITQASREEPIDPPIIAIKSTVIPGTAESLGAMYPYICSNPEFMRQATAVEDFLHPDRIIIGTDNETVREVMASLYADFDAPIICTGKKTAELVKYLSNAYLVMKVAFSQDIKKISDMLRIDALEVAQLVTMDHRIDDSHMNPEMGKISKDSPCLPKDLKALIMQLEKSGYDPLFLKTVYEMGVSGVKLEPSLRVTELEEVEG